MIGGAKALGKAGERALTKITGIDRNRSMRYNLRSVGGKLARGLVGAGIGATAAAVQAGISITDGKYNPLEGIGSFAAGFAGGSRLTGGLQKTFMEGYDANLPEDEQRRRAVEKEKPRTGKEQESIV